MILRNYQNESIAALRSGISQNHTRQVLCASTGAGKSVIMLSMIRSAIEKGSKILFIAERRILVEQFSQHLDRAGIDHGILMAKHWRYRPDQLVQVASAQTLEKMESLPAFDICFIDEIHAAMRKSIINMIKVRPNLKIIGATATPFSPKLSEHFTNVVNVVSMKQLIDEGHLVPFRVFSAKEIDLAGVKTDFKGEFDASQMEVRAKQIIGDVVGDYIRLSNEIYGEYRKGIVFSCGINHGTELAEKFNEAGINAIQISSNDTDDFKSQAIEEFKRPDTDIKLLISSEILERGFDMSDIHFVILAKAVKKSFSKFVQMIGRGARPHPEKSFCVVQDHGNNWLRFSEQWESLFHDGVKVLSAEPDKSVKKEPSSKDKKQAKCPKCGCIWVGQKTCSHCGYQKPVTNEVITVSGEMKELTGKVKKDTFPAWYKEEWYKGMIGLLDSRGANINRAFYMYKEKFGVNPTWKKESGLITQEVRNDLSRANIAYSKRK